MSFVIYSKPGCGFCEKAKELLNSKNLQFSEIVVDVGQQKDDSKTYIKVSELQQLIPGVKSVPQIFKDGHHIGGYDALSKSI